MTDRSERSGHGLGEELRLLVTGLAERAQPWLHRLAADPRADPRADQGPAGARRAGEHQAGGCAWCPVCAGLALARGERPELTARAAEHVAGLLAVLRDAMTEPHPGPAAGPAPASSSTSDAAEPSTSDETGPSTPDGAGPPVDADEPPRPPRVQRIPVRRTAPAAGSTGPRTAGARTTGANREPLC
ncbi:hypothetical protein [Goodfellowiella coeruleoviolacea]|uniref:Uncharacterized protein n=1 Tax=Goodfellowiella coeruleoviolacea TaxID=334858 RepID=A0AAE3KGB5_9PSEU|nr:hypothetical protein [Goodfellowiella coeruleoviolacea]MCP2165319.1 hypothetical protein [Goodfellowiella coeruleoviolacea]